MSLTIPAACLKQLGGLIKTDSPVMLGVPGSTFHPWHLSAGFDRALAMDGFCLLLPSSAPALLQVLARHVGLTLEPGEVPDFSRDDNQGHACWFFSSTLSGQWGQLCSLPTVSPDDAEVTLATVPTLTREMSRMHALAEVFVWCARIERLRALGWDDEARRECEGCGAYQYDHIDSNGDCGKCGDDLAEWLPCVGTQAALAAVEAQLNLPTWTVSE